MYLVVYSVDKNLELSIYFAVVFLFPIKNISLFFPSSIPVV